MRDDSYNFFLSPVTGKMMLTKDYIFVGDDNDMSEESDILIKIKEELKEIEEEIKKITPFPSNVKFVITTPDEKVPNAQTLSTLANGALFTTDGILSTKEIEPFPDDIEFIIKSPDTKLKKAIALTTIGDGVVFNDAGTLTAKQRITLGNLPELGNITIQGIPTPIPQIYGGTSSKTAEISNYLGEIAAESLLFVNRLLAPMWMSKSIFAQTYPSASFVGDLPTGCILKHNNGKPAEAKGGDDYVDFNQSTDGVISIIGQGEKKFVSKSNITITGGDAVDGDHIDKIFSLKAKTLDAKLQISCEDFIIARSQLQAGGKVGYGGELWLFDANHRITTHVGFKAPNNVNSSVVWQLPDKDGNDGDFLSTDGSAVLKWVSSNESLLKDLNEGLVAIKKENNKNKLVNVNLTKGQILIANDNGFPEGKDSITSENLPTLNKDKVWVGDANNKAKEVDFKLASSDAAFVLNTKFDGLDKAQSLSELDTGIMKNETSTGKISIAKAGSEDSDDYISPRELKELKDKLTEPKYVITSSSDILSNAQVLDSLSTGMVKIANGVFEIASGGGSETDDYVKPSNLDTLKTEIEEKIDPLKSQVEEIQGQVEEIQVQTEEIQAQVAALESGATAMEAEIAGIVEEATAAGAAAGGTAGGSAAAVALAGIYSSLSDKEDKYSHKQDIDAVKEQITNDVNNAKTELEVYTNTAIASSIASINVLGTTDEINVTTVGKTFTLSLADKAKVNIDIEGTVGQINIIKQSNTYTISLSDNLVTQFNDISNKINSLNILGVEGETIITKTDNIYTIGLAEKPEITFTLEGAVTGSGTSSSPIITSVSPGIYQNLSEPLNGTDAATKNYVDQQIAWVLSQPRDI